MKKVIIHMGGPKTGSSALQAFFNLNQKLLWENGIDYPLSTKEFSQPYQTSSGNGMILVDLIKQDRRLAKEYLDKKLTGDKNLLLSSEVFFDKFLIGHGDDLFDVLKVYNYECIIYVRPIDTIVNSLINQAIKNHGLKQINNKVVENTTIWYVKRLEYLLNLSDSGYNIIFKPYDKRIFSLKNIYSDFLSSANINIIGRVEYPQKYVNPSFSEEALELKRITNNLLYYQNTSIGDWKYTSMTKKINKILADYSVEKSKSESKLEHKQEVFLFSENMRNKIIKTSNKTYGRLLEKFNEEGKAYFLTRPKEYKYVDLKTVDYKSILKILETYVPSRKLEKRISNKLYFQKKILNRNRYSCLDLLDSLDVKVVQNKELLTLIFMEKYYPGSKKQLSKKILKESKKELANELDLIKKQGAFDKEYYFNAYGDKVKHENDLLLHFCKYGWKKGFNPSPNFNTIAYLKKNSDVERADINPLYHYLKHGKKEGRKLN